MLAPGALAWLDLPEFLIEESSPRICNVLKAGFSMVLAMEARSAGIETAGLPEMPQGVCLPTITIETGGDIAEGLFRLPLGLAHWALDVVAHANTFGVSPFPRKVVFGLRASRYTADML